LAMGGTDCINYTNVHLPEYQAENRGLYETPN